MVTEQEMAPAFEVQADDGSTVALCDFRGQKVILFFYPRADTPGCTTEACEFSDLTPQIQEQGAVVLGISPDTVEDVRKFRQKFEMPFQLLADPDHAVAEAYGVWKEKSMYGRKFMGVDRTTFLIDEEGRIQTVFSKVKPKGHAGEVLSQL
ncbi:thioredoxin-dependent thiol peroxidase [soil metagenome]